MPAIHSNLELRFFPVALLAIAAFLSALTTVAADAQNVPGGKVARPLPESQQIRDFSDATLARIVPGHTAKSEVRSMLGEPWREQALDEDDIPYPGDPSVEVWEYRGKDSKGLYRVHIEFDKNAITTLIAKTPNKAGPTMARVAKPAQGVAK